jgi:large subunit ribosomal protein L16
MLQPKKTKFRKMHKGRNSGIAARGNSVEFGEFGMKATAPARITARQIEAARRVMTRHMNRQGQVVIRIFPDKPITKKPLEVRQGKGKGSVDHWVALVKPGTILFEITGNVSDLLAIEALEKAFSKMPVKVMIAKRSAF